MPLLPPTIHLNGSSGETLKSEVLAAGHSDRPPVRRSEEPEGRIMAARKHGDGLPGYRNGKRGLTESELEAGRVVWLMVGLEEHNGRLTTDGAYRLREFRNGTWWFEPDPGQNYEPVGDPSEPCRIDFPEGFLALYEAVAETRPLPPHRGFDSRFQRVCDLLDEVRAALEAKTVSWNDRAQNAPEPIADLDSAIELLARARAVMARGERAGR